MTDQWARAVASGDPVAVRQLLEEGQDVNARDRYGQTALMNAAHRGEIRIVRLLLEHGADPNVSAKYRLTALMLAMIAGHPDVAIELVEAGADLTVRGGRGAAGFYDRTALDLARERGLDRVVEAIERATEAP